MDGISSHVKQEIQAQGEYLRHNLKLERIEARSIVKLDDNFQTAMEKMEQIQDLLKKLPHVDCGTCGSPSCEALAQDIVQGKADLSRCIFYQRRQELLDSRNAKTNLERMIKVWGREKLEGS